MTGGSLGVMYCFPVTKGSIEHICENVVHSNKNREQISLTFFWDVGNRSWHTGENWLICWFWDFLRTFLYLLTSKKIPTKKILHFLQPAKSETIGKGNLKGRFLKIKLPGKQLQVTNGHISKSKKSMCLILVSN